MIALPHDTTDLLLAPVALAINERIEQLAELELDKLAVRVSIAGDSLTWSRKQREKALLTTVQEFIDCHGWAFAWDARGLRMTHAGHSVVLGVPDLFEDYLSGMHQGR